MIEEAKPSAAPASPPEAAFATRALLTGASGFVGRYVFRELIARGHKPVCLVRDRDRFASSVPEAPPDRYEIVVGDLTDRAALARAATGAEAAIHLVGIIFEHPFRGQTFERVHVEGTRNVVESCRAAGIRRYVHMSALGTRVGAVSAYHRTKYAAERIVYDSGLDWTIFRPSIIHGPDGDFMRLMRLFVCRASVPVCGFLPGPFPVIPYFGDGQNKLQPVSVKDVAHCFVAALSRPDTIGRVFELGGPEAMSWKELYRTCRDLIPGARTWKPMIGQPVWMAKLIAGTLMRLPIMPEIMRFNAGQVEMSQEDSVCDTRPIEEAFGIRLRDFRAELEGYGGLIE